MAHYKAADSKREQFRRYLEKSGVLDTLTKAEFLGCCYSARALRRSFLKHHLGASAPENPEIEALRLEVAEMKEKYEAVLEENKNLKIKMKRSWYSSTCRNGGTDILAKAFFNGSTGCLKRLWDVNNFPLQEGTDCKPNNTEKGNL